MVVPDRRFAGLVTDHQAPHRFERDIGAQSEEAHRDHPQRA
jgi:hypothetical protein